MSQVRPPPSEVATRPPLAVGALVKHFQPQPQAVGHFASHCDAAQAEILAVIAAIDLAAAAAENAPFAEILFRPEGQQQGGMLVADAARNAGQEDARKDAEIEALVFLMQEAVFGRDFDISQPGMAGRVIGQRHHACQLQVGRAAIIEVDPGLARHAALRLHAIGEGIDLEMPVVRWLGIVRQIGRPRPRGAATGGQHRGREKKSAHQWAATASGAGLRRPLSAITSTIASSSTAEDSMRSRFSPP